MIERTEDQFGAVTTQDILLCQDPYVAFKLPRDFTKAQLKSAYRSLATKFHPDLAKADQKVAATVAMQKINDWYQLLLETLDNPSVGGQASVNAGDERQVDWDFIAEVEREIMERMGNKKLFELPPEITAAYVEHWFFKRKFDPSNGTTADNPLEPRSGMDIVQVLQSAAYVALHNPTKPGFAYFNWSGTDLEIYLQDNGKIGLRPLKGDAGLREFGYSYVKETLVKLGYIDDDQADRQVGSTSSLQSGGDGGL